MTDHYDTAFYTDDLEMPGAGLWNSDIAKTGREAAETELSKPDADRAEQGSPDAEQQASPVRKRRRRRGKKQSPAVAYLDTEFNAFDYYGQNGGHQEIIQIGVVIMQGGQQTDSFQSFCALRRGHVLSKRSMKLTGIGRADLADAPAFPEVLSALNAFLEEHRPAHIYAYGSEDRQQLLNTAHLHNLKKDVLQNIELIEDIMKQLSQALGIRKRSNLTLSVRDLCEICGVDAAHRHDAMNDAVYLALCAELIRRGAFEADRVTALLERKSWASNYRIARRIKEQGEHLLLEDRDFTPIREMIERLEAEGQYPRYQLRALYDDLLMVSGRLPELEG